MLSMIMSLNLCTPISAQFCPKFHNFFVRNLRIFIINNGQKSFITLGPADFVISQSAFSWQAFPVQSNKHSSLVRKSVNHGPKSFITLAPGVIVAKLLTAVINSVTLKASVFVKASKMTGNIKGTSLLHYRINYGRP